jgi:signal transduction histidine kinase
MPSIDFEALFAVAPAAVLVLSPADDFAVVAVNDAYLHATMTTRDGIVGRGLFDVFPDNPMDPNASGAANLRQSLERVRTTRRPDHMALQKYDIRRPADAGAGFEERWWSPTNTPVLDADGNVACIIHCVVDATEQRRHEEQLRQARTDAEWARERTARLQALSAALSVAASTNDIAEALVSYGAPVLGAVGIIVARATSDGKALEIMRAGDLAEDIRTEWERIPLEARVPLADAARTRSPIYLEGRADWQARYPDLIPLLEATGHCANAIAPIVAGEKLLGVIGAAYDHDQPFDDVNRAILLTVAEQVGFALQRARLLEAEQAARAEAELANSAKSQFLAVMSHELRTPLNAIGGHAQLIEMGIHGPVTPEQLTALERIQRSQRHLLGLINAVLNYAKVDAGAVQYAAEMVVLDDVLATCEALIAPQARAKGLALTYAGCDRLTRLWADREKVQQVVLNLLSNAVKFTEPGGVVKISWASDADRVAITVGDTGRGIPADQLERVFQPFVQLDVRLTRTQEGTGLGLAISRDLARGMGGDLVVESTERVGSAFTLTLPARAR